MNLDKNPKDKAKDTFNVFDLEEIKKCPYCGHSKKITVFDNASDLAFKVAPGKWNYQKCSSCASIFLNPRPNRHTIGNAYSNYYTHSGAKRSLKIRLWDDWYDLNLKELPSKSISFKFFSKLIRPILQEPEEIRVLSKLRPGRVLDVGCGNGEILWILDKMGWSCTGIEIDSAAVQAANARGLNNVVQGDFEIVGQYKNYFDAIICSHVIEHIHQPKKLIQLIYGALELDGIVLLSCPNATSPVFALFGKYWRGLEAPRHLVIPSEIALINAMCESKLEAEIVARKASRTFGESVELLLGLTSPSRTIRAIGRFIDKVWSAINRKRTDFIQIIAKK